MSAAALAPSGAGTAPRATDIAVHRAMMGGRVVVALRGGGAGPRPSEADVERVLDRIGAWAARLTRFDASSELCRLNDAPAGPVAIGPTLTAVLDWARMAEGLTDGLVDVAMLDARLAAESGVMTGGNGRSAAADTARLGGGRRRWSLTRRPRGSLVSREGDVRFDLDGVAKGWLADRALGIAPGPSALVDGDGDVAMRVAPGDAWVLGIADPRDAGGELGILALGARHGRPTPWGLATSGTTVHRWSHAFGATHHLIDPRTRRPAVTDVVQATVLADTARAAEAFAKVAVVVGAEAAFDRLDRPDVHGLLLLTDDGEVRASEGMVRWLA